MKGVFSIGIDRRFADELAAGILAEHAGDPLKLADVLILLPTRRSVRSLREAFLRAANGRPTLLPQMAPLGDLDDGAWDDRPDGDALALPPAIDQTEREALLSELVLRFPGEDGEPIAQTTAQALKLARELASLLDELAIDGVPFEKLEALVDGNFATHWQRTLRFLAIVGENWPQILAARGQIDALDRRTRAIRAQAARWRERPPANQVIAAGSTGSQPATRELLATIAGLPQGAVVLPGLDREMDEASWAKLDPTHPQFGLRELLAALGCDRDGVADWPGSSGDRARRQLISELMRPGETTDTWQRPNPAALEHVTRADCATPHQEALVIALALREALETPHRTAALVTPDRDLARRVTAELRRWTIDIDDSAGQQLADAPPATLLRVLLAAVDSSFAPVDLLALLKHPLCTLGLARAELLDAARRLDRKGLRGLKPDPGLAVLKEKIAQDRADVIDLVDRLIRATADLCTAVEAGAAPSLLIDLTIAAAEQCASGDALWSGDAGEALADALASLRAAWSERQEIASGEWPALLTTMLATETIRPHFGRHPRLAIWGPLEARLQRADLLILGGLNEGSWPPAVETGPWINRPMRRQLGLPQPERRIGLSAHDFASALAAERVLLTRAEREGGAPTVPSRWLARLDALFGWDAASGLPPPEYIQRGQRTYVAWAGSFDDPADYKPWLQPRPRPPLEARPKQLSVSSIEQWRRDPYGLYARQVLRLRRLDPLEEELGAAERGSRLHDTLDEFLKAYPDGALPADALAIFETMGERHLETVLAAPAERAFWWPRFKRLAHWFVATESARRAAGTRLLASETRGSLVLGPLTVTAIADRVDETEPGGWNIIDYKTGRVPSKKELAGFFSPQLLLEAAMQFEDIDRPARTVQLSYWQANGLGDGGRVIEVEDSDALVSQMIALVQKMIDHFGDPSTPYAALPWPEFIPHFNDYEHLERVAEWSSTEKDEWS
ncbi:MAG: double-strand break repair protein AddB [Reyranella sp.]|uniref:double-strand break repair protein AddB n=1 Tax=Reyranella sp. TaxID=1929291 RepID=UPI001AC020B1|nr:double-strand break repair protein AddB [Reyranella sp.]MBN9089798.1 double-strand break repair protein AddB [Reyranella sp.]